MKFKSALCCSVAVFAVTLHGTAYDFIKIAAAAALIGGTAFGLMQLKEFTRHRRDIAAGDLMHSFMGTDFTNAMTIIMGLPDDLSAEALRRAGPDVEKAAVLVETTFETVGLLVFERITPFSLVLDLAGGTIILMWRKLRPWLVDLRAETSNPYDGEWFQWLAEQCARRKTAKEPAHIGRRDWEP